MKFQTLILLLWFAAGMLAEFSLLTERASFMSWSGSYFQSFGPGWIWLMSLWYGIAAILLGTTLLFFFTKPRLSWIPLLFCITMVATDHFPRQEPWQESYTDKCIYWFGYACSLISPQRPQDKPIPEGLRPVIPPRTRIQAETPLGRIAITSGNGLLRTFEWDGVSRSLELLPPDQSQYGDPSFHSRHHVGSLRTPSYDWSEHKGITCGETWESYKNFDSVDAASGWLEGETEPCMPAVWTHDGLLVEWSTGVDYRALTVIITQVLINGKKPTHLPGSSDDRFVSERL